MTTIKRPRKYSQTKEQRLALMKTILLLLVIGLCVILLFRSDPFARSKHKKKKILDAMINKSILKDNNNPGEELSKIKLQQQLNAAKSDTADSSGAGVINSENEGHLLRGHDHSFIKTVDELAAEEPIEEGSRLFVLELAGLDATDNEAGATPSSTTGSIVLRTRPSWAPIGVKHFHELLDANFYKGCKFFRVLPNFVVQFGISPTPLPNDHKYRQSILDDPVVHTNARGTITFATSGENSRTSQVFINTRSSGNQFLDNEGFAPIAEIIQGMDIVDRIFSKHREKPDQMKIQRRGNEYLDSEFPNLSYIQRVQHIPYVDDMQR